jgi:hypothetical protein
MASSGFVFNSAMRDEALGNITYNNDSFKVMLLTSTATPNKDTWTRRSDVTNEVTGSGYSAGGTACTVTVGATDTTNDRVDTSLGAVTWPASTITARYAIYYKTRGGASSADELIACVDFGQDVSTISDTFSLTASTLRKTNP